MAIDRVGVIGAGLMGSGIAEVFARSGIETVVCEVNEQALAAGRGRIQKSLARGTETGKITANDAQAIEGRLTFATEVDSVAECDLVIEAIVENLDVKRELFTTLDKVTRDTALLASNTSALPIIELAAATTRADRVVGLHFFNPAPVMKLLEVVRSIATSDETMGEVNAIAERIGKTTIIAKDRGGFIVNLLLIPYLTHAIRVFEAGHATREDIDTGMKLGCGHPMGPLELLDYVGLDTSLFVCEALHKEYGNPEYAPPPLLRRMVSAGYLGRKSGRGFYEHAR